MKAIIVMGTDQEGVIAQFKNSVELIGQVNTLEEAVSHAYLVADSGDVVLFSPACSDYEKFQSTTKTQVNDLERRCAKRDCKRYRKWNKF